ncbi:MAG: serine/threonine-protein kinase [Bacillota bacterium]|nr:serine/threonine-protein kinase [Bacillota bacterium]
MENMIGKVVKNKYKIERILGEGATSVVYLCRNIELGNLWALKHMAKTSSHELLSEKRILEKLNHICLPKLADVFEDDKGKYIVVSYIEGIPLNKILETQGSVAEKTVIAWAKQICEVLIYLHTLPTPIIYRDLKPHNVIITRDNRPVLIDFGISREYKGTGRKDTVRAGTPLYAAPEQLTSGASDVRSDIYSLGVTLHHLLTGCFPESDIARQSQTNSKTSRNMDYIIRKCIEYSPEDRYQSVNELLSDLNNINKGVLNKKLRRINRIIFASSIIMTIISFSSIYLGFTDLKRENSAFLLLTPQIMSISLNQTGSYKLEKKYSDGDRVDLKASDIEWKYLNSDIATIKDGKILPLKEGKTEFDGTYNKKPIKLTVLVNKHMDGFNETNINLKYLKNINVYPFAGTGQHDDLNGNAPDGPLKTAILAEPTSLSFGAHGELYVADLKSLRLIKEGLVKTLEVGKEVDLVKTTSSGNIYFSVKPYENEKQQMVSEIYVLKDNKPFLIYKDTESRFNISDFAFDSSENMYVLQHVSASDKILTKITFVDRLNSEKRSEKYEEIIESITLDKYDNLYVSSFDDGVIYKWNKALKTFGIFAGKKGDKHFIDGADNRFFAPRKIVAHGDYMYVIDSNILRRIAMNNGNLVDVETIAGSVENSDKYLSSTSSYNVVFSKPRDLAIDVNGDIFMSDSNNYRIWKIQSYNK